MDIITKRRKELEEGVSGAIVGMHDSYTVLGLIFSILKKFNSCIIKSHKTYYNYRKKFSSTINSLFMDFTPFSKIDSL